MPRAWLKRLTLSDDRLDIYEDIEGSIWVATPKGIDRFHDIAVASFSATEGLTTDAVSSVLGARHRVDRK